MPPLPVKTSVCQGDKSVKFKLSSLKLSGSGGGVESQRKDSEGAESGSGEVVRCVLLSFLEATKFFRLPNIFFILLGLARKSERA